MEQEERLVDIADLAARAEERLRAEAIEQSRLASEREAQALGSPTGFCMNCSTELFDPTGRFCDADCGADWTNRREAQRRNGT